MKKSILVMALALSALSLGTLAEAEPRTEVIVQSLAGSNDPTRATLALIGAWGIAEAGHDVKVVLAGEAVYLLNPTVAESTVGVGLGDAKGWLDKLQTRRVPIYYCGGCGKARDVDAKDIKASGAKSLTAVQWGRMVGAADRVVSY